MLEKQGFQDVVVEDLVGKHDAGCFSLWDMYIP